MQAVFNPAIGEREGDLVKRSLLNTAAGCTAQAGKVGDSRVGIGRAGYPRLERSLLLGVFRLKKVRSHEEMKILLFILLAEYLIFYQPDKPFLDFGMIHINYVLY
jgi:hypothetical protein